MSLEDDLTKAGLITKEVPVFAQPPEKEGYHLAVNGYFYHCAINPADLGLYISSEGHSDEYILPIRELGVPPLDDEGIQEYEDRLRKALKLNP